MIEKGEVSFAEECKRLLDLRDEIGTKGDKKHEKREAKALLKHKYYWIHKEEDTLFNGMKAVYKILFHCLLSDVLFIKIISNCYW